MEGPPQTLSWGKSMRVRRVIGCALFGISLSAAAPTVVSRAPGSWGALNQEAQAVGKPEWRPMLQYVAELHRRSTHPAQWPFPHEWEEIGPGYVHGPAFGHWDIVHQSLDVMASFPEHSLRQLLNNIAAQEPTGLVPGSIWMPGARWARDGKATWNTASEGHPPVWVFAVEEYVRVSGDASALAKFYPALVRQIAWFENARRAEGEGFFYNDILTRNWESGVDEGVRFDEPGMMRSACVDATSHVYFLYRTAARWSATLGLPAEWSAKREGELGRFIREDLYVKEDETFYDQWAVGNAALRHLTFESMWPVVVGAATPEQAQRFIDRHLLDASSFLTRHPIATVGVRDPKFSLRMWRGPAWNSMTYWAAVGCLRYGRKDAARKLLEGALDGSSAQFRRTGTVWEFYHPLGGVPEDVARKPKKPPNLPCRDYLGHNPLIAMARLYDATLR